MVIPWDTDGRRAQSSSGGNCRRRRAARASLKLNAIAAAAARPASPNVTSTTGNPGGGGGGGGPRPADTTRSVPVIPAPRSPYGIPAESVVRLRTTVSPAVALGAIGPVVFP